MKGLYRHIMAGRKIFSLFGEIVVEGLTGTTTKLTKFEKEIRATNKVLNKLGRQATKTGKAFTKNITAPLGVATVAIIKFGADFDQAMTNSLAIMGDVSDSMRKDLEGVARDVAKTTKFSAKEAADAYYFLASAGLDAAQSMKMLPKVAAFAQAGNFDLAIATDLLTDAQSALGLASDDTAEHMENTARVSDVLVQANKDANASVLQFSEALTNKAGVALALLDKDIEEGVAILQVYADKGLAKGADAGTQLNIVLRDLQNAATKNKQAFKDAGIAVFDTDGKMRHIADVIEDMDNRLGSMTDEQKRSELMMLGFTSKSIDATSALLGTSDAIREYEKQLKRASGVTQEVADKQMKTFWMQMGLIKDRAIDLGLTLYEYLGPVLMNNVVPVLDAIIEKVAAMIEWFGKHKTVATFVGTFVAAAVVMGPLILAFVKMIPLMKLMYATYKLLITGQITLNAVMKANMVGLIVTGILLLIAAGVTLWKNWDTIKEKFIDVWDGIKYHFKNISDTINIMYGSMILGILKGINSIARFIPGMSKGLAKAISTVEGVTTALKNQKAARIAANKAQKAANKLSEEEKKVTEAAAKTAEEKAAKDKDAKEKQDKLDKEIAAKKKVLTLQETKDNEQKNKKKAEFEKGYTDKVFEQSSTRLETLKKERKDALAEADKLGADKTDIKTYYDEEEKKLTKELNDQKKKAEQQIQNDLTGLQIEKEQDKLTRLDMQLAEDIRRNEEEKDEAIRIATEKGIAVNNIEKLYAAREVKIEADAAIEKTKINEEAAKKQEATDKKTRDKKISNVEKVVGVVSSVANQLNSIWQADLERRTAQIDEETENKKLAIESSVMSEEAKASAIATIDEEADAKKLELQKENAQREKMMAIFSIILNTAMAITGALAMGMPAGLVLAVLVGVLGVAQIAIAAATPLPFAEGALVKSSPGKGVLAQVGEGNQDELVLPMETGAAQLADNIMGRMAGAGAGAIGAVGAVGQAATTVVKETHLHIGTLIADEFGLKRLSKVLNKYTVAESQRTGGAYGTA